MDPLSIAAGALSIVGSLYGVSAFIKASTGMRRISQSLQIQVDGLLKVLNTLRITLERPALEQYAKDNNDLWKHMNESVMACKATADELLVKLDPVSNPSSNEIRQAWRNVRLGLSQDDLDRLMAAMRTHSIHLQLSMAMVNTLINESGFERLERMITAIDSKLQTRASELPSVIDNDIGKIVLNDNTVHLRQIAVSIMSSAGSEGGLSGDTECPSTWNIASAFDHLDLRGKTAEAFEDSTTGSELGRELDDAQRGHIHNWITMPQIDEASESTAPNSRPNDLASLFSETSTGLETQATEVSGDRHADSSDEEDDDVDFQVAQSLFSSASTKFEANQFAAAEKLFKSSLEQSQHLKYKQQEALRIKEMCLHYAICKLQIGKLDESETLFLAIVNEPGQSVNEPAEKAGDAKRVFDAYHGLASIHLRKASFRAAEIHCRQALKGRKKKRVMATSPEDYFDSLKLYAAILRAQEDTIRAQAYLNLLPNHRQLSIPDLDEVLRSEYFFEAKPPKVERTTRPVEDENPRDPSAPLFVPKDEDKALEKDMSSSRLESAQQSPLLKGTNVRSSYASSDHASLSKIGPPSHKTSMGSSPTLKVSDTNLRLDKKFSTSSTPADLSNARLKIKKEGFFRTGRGNKGLLWAAKNGKLHEISVLLEECLVDINTQRTGRFEAHETPLFLAAEKGHAEICARLLSASANLDLPNSSNDTPLVKAAENGEILVCKLLLEHGAKVNGLIHGGRPLVRAAGFARFHEAQKKATSLEICQLLLSWGADVNAGDLKGRPPLMMAAMCGNKEVCVFLLERGAEMDRIDGEGRTALMRAAESDQLEICRMLLNRGANYLAKDFRGKAALDLMPFIHQKQALAAHWDKVQSTRRALAAS